MFENFAGMLSNSWDSVEGFFNGSSSAHRNWRYSKEAARLQDQLQRQLLVDAPSLQREGLEKAGFNPLLAVEGGISSPSSATQVQAPQSQPRLGLGDVVSLISSAFGNYTALAKLGGDVALTHAQADATRATSAADVALKSAQAAKTIKESESIDPKIRRQNEKYGNGLVGESMKFVRTLANSVGFDDVDVHVPTPFNNVSTNSAKGLNSAVKLINESVHREEKRRGDAVRKRRMHH